MKVTSLRVIPSLILVLCLSVGEAPAQQKKVSLGDNAALRYWSAIGQMQDQAINDAKMKELSEILNGKAAYDARKFKDLVEKNRRALETMARGTTLRDCNWGLEYAQGLAVPLPYLAKAAALARLNVLYAFHLQSAGDKEGAVRVLIAGLRFSHDIANGAPMLVATLIAKDSLAKHLLAIASITHKNGFSPQQRMTLRKALAELGPDPLDWRSPEVWEIEALSLTSHAHSKPWPCSIPPGRIVQDWVRIFDDASTLPELEKTIGAQPKECRDFFPSPRRILNEKQDLDGRIHEALSLLQ